MPFVNKLVKQPVQKDKKKRPSGSKKASNKIKKLAMVHAPGSSSSSQQKLEVLRVGRAGGSKSRKKHTIRKKVLKKFYDGSPLRDKKRAAESVLQRIPLKYIISGVAMKQAECEDPEWVNKVFASERKHVAANRS